MDKRPNLQALLESVAGNRNVYFQPPSTIQMRYPAIVYSRSGMPANFANNEKYINHVTYKVTVIDQDPDSDIVKRVNQLPNCSFNNHYVSDNLNHDVFTIHY